MKTTTNNGSVIDLEAGKPKAPGCNCWEETDQKLQGKGFRLAPSLSALSWRQFGSCPLIRLLPLTRADGTKVKRGEPSTLQISHCPFCGVPLATA